MGVKFNPFTGNFDITGGDVSGPTSSTNLEIPVFSGTSGKILTNSGATIGTDGTIKSMNTTYPDTTCYGKTLVPQGDKSVFIGSTISGGTQSVYAGYNILAGTGTRNVILAYSPTLLTNVGSVVNIGYGTYSQSSNSITIGNGALVGTSAGGSIAIGPTAYAYGGISNFSMGDRAKAYATLGYATAIGPLAEIGSAGTSSFVTGRSSYSNASCGLGLGSYTNIGTGHDYSAAVGCFSTTTKANQLMFGGYSAGVGGFKEAVFGYGETSATTFDFTVKFTSASGTNIAGKDVYFDAPQGTGTGSGGSFYLRTAPAGSTGSSLNSQMRQVKVATNGVTYKAPIATKTSNYTLTENDSTVLFDCTSGALTATLPAAASSSGVKFNIKKISASNNLTIDANASETIDGATTAILTTQYESITIHCDGSAWWIL